MKSSLIYDDSYKFYTMTGEECPGLENQSNSMGIPILPSMEGFPPITQGVTSLLSVPTSIIPTPISFTSKISNVISEEKTNNPIPEQSFETAKGIWWKGQPESSKQLKRTKEGLDRVLQASGFGIFDRKGLEAAIEGSFKINSLLEAQQVPGFMMSFLPFSILPFSLVSYTNAAYRDDQINRVIKYYDGLSECVFNEVGSDFHQSVPEVLDALDKKKIANMFFVKWSRIENNVCMSNNQIKELMTRSTEEYIGLIPFLQRDGGAYLKDFLGLGDENYRFLIQLISTDQGDNVLCVIISFVKIYLHLTRTLVSWKRCNPTPDVQFTLEDLMNVILRFRKLINGDINKFIWSIKRYSLLFNSNKDIVKGLKPYIKPFGVDPVFELISPMKELTKDENTSKFASSPLVTVFSTLTILLKKVLDLDIRETEDHAPETKEQFVENLVDVGRIFGADAFYSCYGLTLTEEEREKDRILIQAFTKSDLEKSSKKKNFIPTLKLFSTSEVTANPSDVLDKENSKNSQIELNSSQ